MRMRRTVSRETRFCCRFTAAERLRLEIERQRSANAEINKKEMGMRVRELRVYRRLARLERASVLAPRARQAPPRPVRARAPVVILPPSQQ